MSGGAVAAMLYEVCFRPTGKEVTACEDLFLVHSTFLNVNPSYLDFFLSAISMRP